MRMPHEFIVIIKFAWANFSRRFTPSLAANAEIVCYDTNMKPWELRVMKGKVRAKTGITRQTTRITRICEKKGEATGKMSRRKTVSSFDETTHTTCSLA